MYNVYVLVDEVSTRCFVFTDKRKAEEYADRIILEYAMEDCNNNVDLLNSDDIDVCKTSIRDNGICFVRNEPIYIEEKEVQ